MKRVFGMSAVALTIFLSSLNATSFVQQPDSKKLVASKKQAQPPAEKPAEANLKPEPPAEPKLAIREIPNEKDKDKEEHFDMTEMPPVDRKSTRLNSSH